MAVPRKRKVRPYKDNRNHRPSTQPIINMCVNVSELIGNWRHAVAMLRCPSIGVFPSAHTLHSQSCSFFCWRICPHAEFSELDVAPGNAGPRLDMRLPQIKSSCLRAA